MLFPSSTITSVPLLRLGDANPALGCSHIIAIERAGPSHTSKSLQAQKRAGPVPLDRFLAQAGRDHWDQCHTMRGQIITLKQNDYVRAAYAVGAKGPRVLYRHLLMNTLGVIIVFVFLELPGVILGEAFLSFLGLGINPPKASWGTLAQDGYTAYATHPYIIVIPSICIAWLILSAFFIADVVASAMPSIRPTASPSRHTKFHGAGSP